VPVARSRTTTSALKSGPTVDMSTRPSSGASSKDELLVISSAGPGSGVVCPERVTQTRLRRSSPRIS
jgi:hypothetical protein